jgi:TPR repeat protein
LAQTAPIKRFAVQLLKPAAKQGVVAAQSRLGCLLCHEAADLRDRRVGQEMLRLAARAGDHGAREALECLTAQLRLPSLRSSRQG